MLIEYLLSRRMTGENEVAYLFSVPAILLIFNCPLAAFAVFMVWLGAVLYGGFRIWYCSSVWNQLRERRVMEELATTGIGMKRLVDEVTWFACRGVWKATAVGVLLCIACIGLTGGDGGKVWAWSAQMALSLLIIWIALPVSLSYTVQAWSLWSSLGWWWAIIGVPILYEFLVALAALPASMFSNFLISIAVGSVTVCWLSRKLAHAGLERDRVTAPVRRRWHVGRAPIRQWGNPVWARGLARFGGRPVLAAIVLMVAASWGAVIGGDVGHSLGEAMVALFGAFTCLAWVVRWLAYRTARVEKDGGTLELLKMTRLSGNNVVDGWVATAAFFPMLIALVALPFGLSFSGLFDPVPPLTAALLGLVGMVLCGYLGVYVALFWRAIDIVWVVVAWVGFTCFLDSMDCGPALIHFSLVALAVMGLAIGCLRAAMHRRWNTI